MFSPFHTGRCNAAFQTWCLHEVLTNPPFVCAIKNIIGPSDRARAAMTTLCSAVSPCDSAAYTSGRHTPGPIPMHVLRLRAAFIMYMYMTAVCCHSNSLVPCWLMLNLKPMMARWEPVTKSCQKDGVALWMRIFPDSSDLLLVLSWSEYNVFSPVGIF